MGFKIWGSHLAKSLLLGLICFLFIASFTRCGQGSPGPSSSPSVTSVSLDFGTGIVNNNTYALSSTVSASMTLTPSCAGYTYPTNNSSNNSTLSLPTGIACTLSLVSFQLSASGETYTVSQTQASVGSTVVAGTYTGSAGGVMVVTPVISGSLNPVKANTSIYFTYQSTNTVTASLSPNYKSLFGVVSNYTGSLSLTFKTNTSSANNLSISPSSLPSGFAFSGNVSTCNSVDNAGSCSLSLTYSPSTTDAAPTKASIPFTYTTMTGTTLTGTLNFNYQGLSRMKWTFPHSGCGVPAVSLDGNTVYVACSDSYLRALDAATGKVNWTSNLALYNPSPSPLLNPTGSLLYVESNTSSGYVYAVNATTGVQTWATNTPCASWLFFPGALNPASSLFFGACRSGIVRAYNTSDGSQLWASANISTGTLASTPVVSPDGNRVYIGGGGNNRVYALNTSNGATAWSALTGATTYGGPGVVSADSSTIYWASDKLYALSATTGSTNWQVSVGTGGVASALTFNPAQTHVYLSPIDGYVYGVRISDQVQTFKSAEASSVSTGNSVKINFSPDGNTLYIGCGDAYYRAFNVADGSLKWRFSVGSALFSNGAVGVTVSPDGNTIYIGSNGNAYALNENVVIQ